MTRVEAFIDVVVRFEAEKLTDGSWKFRIFDRTNELVSDGWSHPGPDFEAGVAFQAMVTRWRSV